jgi:hypothetical protein
MGKGCILPKKHKRLHFTQEAQAIISYLHLNNYQVPDQQYTMKQASDKQLQQGDAQRWGGGGGLGL